MLYIQNNEKRNNNKKNKIMYVPQTESFKNNKNELLCISHQFLRIEQYNASLHKHPGA